jgi:beta-barrel assembly-enhancing protease
MLRNRYALILLVISMMLLQMACGGSSSRMGKQKSDTHFKPGFNLFKPEQDIELGKRSAQEVARQMPLLRDEQIVGYVQRLGAKLAEKAGGYKFPYQFQVTAVKDINAFALPGGFMFVNAGAIAAAKNEGELAGVMAHEISHVALRHGTNQATKAYIAKAGLSVLTGVAGGSDSDLGQVIETIGGVGANALFLKFGRTAETQADLEGARIMAEAGYDPRDMAAFFKTLQSQAGGQRAPEILSDHPDPGNRIEEITRALPSLPVSQNPVRTTQEFEQVKGRLTGNRAALTSDEPARVGAGEPGKMGKRPEPPSSSYKRYQSRDNSFALEIPDNWESLTSDEENLILAPNGAYGKLGENLMVTHGIFVGAMPVEQRDLESATRAFVQQQIEANPDFRVARPPQRIEFGDRQAYATVVAGQSPVTGVIEIDVIYTTATSDGRLFYFVSIVPEDEMESYKATFEHIINSIRLAQ